MRVILVDDEQHSLTVLENLLADEKHIEIVGSYTDPLRALAELEKTNPQGALLDIEMLGMNGLELGERLINIRPEIAIVYVTAYSEYALDAFEVNAIDYLLKPISAKRLNSALNRMETRRLREDLKSEFPELKESQEESQVLKLKSFGGFEIYDAQGEVISWRTKKAKELFVYLWLRRGGFVNRDHIIEEVFPDKTADRGSALLHTTVYQIRNSLRAAGFENTIEFVNESYKLNIETDSEAKRVREILEKEKLSNEDAQSLPDLCQGEFLEEGYPWLYYIKQEYKDRLFRILDDYVSKKMEENESGYLTEELAKLMLRINHYSEAAAEYLIKAYGMNNKKKEMSLFYKSFTNFLNEEMGEGPGKELEESFEKYLKNSSF